MTSAVTQTPGLRFLNAADARAQIPLIYNPTTGDYDLATSSDGLLNVATFVWNTGTLSWDKATQAGGGGGGGGAVTIADGADVAEGATTDAAVITDTAGTISGKLRGLVKWAFERMPASLGQKVMTESFPVVIASDQSTVPVSGSLGRTWDLSFAADQVDVSGSTVGAVVTGTVTVDDGGGSITIDAVSLPLPTGAATEATLATRLADATFTARINTQGQKTMAASTPVVVASDQSSIPTHSRASLTAVATTFTTVDMADSTVVAANANRKGLVFVNLSDSLISFGIGTTALLYEGISLLPGGVWEMDEYTFSTAAIHAIAETGSANFLSTQEFQ